VVHGLDVVGDFSACPQLIVPGGTWKATVLESGAWGLLGEAVG
jgi:predicted cupin superfamily sugar epimerase